MEKKLEEYIENIEQLGADARYYKDYKKYEKVRIQLESIEHWAKKAIKVLDEIEKESE